MRSCFAVILVCYFFSSTAQLPRDIKFTNYTRANGLPDETINNIKQDSRGYLWIGSREGLFRFDGKNYKAWYADPSDSNKFGNNSIIIAGEYKNGRMMFQSGTSLWEIDIYNHRFRQLEQFKEKTIIAAPQRLGNGQWIVSAMDSVFITDSSFKITLSQSYRNIFPTQNVAGFYLQHPYALLYAIADQNYCLLNYTTGKRILFQVDNSKLDSRSKYVRPQVYDSIKHRLYLSSYFNGNSYIDLDLDAGRNIKYEPINIAAQSDGSIRRALLLPEKNLMIQAGVNGLYFTDFMNTTYFNSTSGSDKKMASNILLDLFHSADGDYWLSTTNGICRFSLQPPLVNYFKQSGINSSQDEIKRIIKGNDGNIYFLRQSKSLFKLSPDKLSAERVDSSIYYCWTAIPSGDNIIIVGAGKKIATYNTITKRHANPTDLDKFYSNNTDIVTLAYRAKNGDLWYSCNGSGGLIRNPAGTTQYIQYSRNSSPPAFSHSYVHNVAEDKEGNIWWGSNKTEMLLRWDAAKQSFSETGVHQLIPQHKLQTGVNNLYFDNADNLWIALDAAALIKYNIKTHTGGYYDINKGLPTDAVFGLCSDAQNRLWFSTRKGLCCYLPDKDQVVNFTSSDGLPEDNFEDDGMYFDKSDNLLYIGGNETIAYFNPDSLLLKSIINVPPVFIDEMRVNGKLFYFENEKKIRLKTKENNIEFSYSAPDFNRNSQLIFQYRLQGINDDWIDLGEKRTITLNGLRYGKYTFSVRCTYRGTQTWKETSQPFTFTIQTPLQNQLWFRLLLLAIASLLVFWIIRNYYRRKLEKQRLAAENIQAIEKERTRIATDMHDDFGASLSRIKFISEKMQLMQSDNPSLTNDLTKISVYSDQMAEKMNEIVWALNQRYDSIEDLVSFCRSYASEYLQDKGITLHFSTDGTTEKMLKGETRRNVFLVIKEALHNIVKHAEATVVDIHFSQTNLLKVSINDNGKGFNSDSIHAFANGLENMKKRMSDVGGELKITSETGTQISISVPI